MESRAKLLGHPVHQMLVPLPAGLFVVAAVLDIVDTFVNWTWIPTVTYWNIALGIGTALLAAVFGAADAYRIPNGTRAKRVAVMHGVGNVIAVALFGTALWLRTDDMRYGPSALALGIEVTAFALLAVTGWLGGELVDRLGVGVDDGAHVDAPSSLQEKHVSGLRH